MNLKSKARALPAIIQVGKAGLTEAVIEEIKVQLKNKKLVKVKFLRSAIKDEDKKELFKELADKTKSEIIHQVGFVVALYKKIEKIYK